MEHNPQGWQPIETAPRDGREILFGHRPPWAAEGNVTIGFWHPDSNDWRAIRTGAEIVPEVWTYWQPLPGEPSN